MHKQMRKSPSREPKNSAQKPAILCVDDDPAILELQMVILKHRGYEAIPARSAEEAWSRLARIIPDVLVLDVMMPGMSGFDLARKMQNDPLYRHLPIAFVTACRESADFRRGFGSGGLVYLSKPFTSRSLLTAVDCLLGLKAENRHTILSLGCEKAHV